MGAIVWLASYPKSGNTWLRAFLTNLIANRDTPVPFEDYANFTSNEASAHWFATRLKGRFDRSQMPAVAAMRGEVQREIAATGNPYLLVKTHSYQGDAFGHPQINADVTAAAIYVVRNPLDVAISFANHNASEIDQAISIMAKPGTSSSMANGTVFEWTSDWSTHVASWTAQPNEHLCVVRYEDMIDQPLETFSRIAQFLRIEADEMRIRRAIDASSFDRLQEMEREGGFAEKPDGADVFFRAGRKDQWREVLTTEQVRRISARHRTQMQRFGYA